MRSNVQRSFTTVMAALSLSVGACYDLRPRAEQRMSDDASALEDRAPIDDSAVTDAELDVGVDGAAVMDASSAEASSDAQRDSATDASSDAQRDSATDASGHGHDSAGPDAAVDTGVDAGPIVCAMGFERLGATCVAVGAAPRPISPMSLGEVTRRRPTLRWELPAGMDGVLLELCRDRACTVLIESQRVTGTTALPTIQLPTRTTVYWRLRGTSGAATSAALSPTWMFRVPASTVTTGVDSSSNPHFDCNGDGFDDVLVSAPTASPGGRAAAGRVSLFMGSATGIAATPSLVLEGATAGDHFGEAISNAGDVNGDGYADLIVGSAYAVAMVGAEARSGAGRAQVFHGGPTGLSNSPALTLSGALMDDNFGRAVSTAGDVDADGYADVVIASPIADTGRGSAGVYHGRATGLSPTPAVVLNGVDSFNQFGLAVTHAGDLNGDGFSDIAIALPLAPYTAPSTGQVRVYFGASAGIRASSSLLLAGGAHADRFGRSIAGAVDVNNDGYSDLVVGAFRADTNGQTDAGAAYVFHGRAMGIDAAPTHTLALPAPAASDYFGFSVVGIGDSNGDGYGDLAIAAQGADGAGRADMGIVAIYQGSATGITAISRTLEGAAAGEAFGTGLGFVGDVNGDGYPDLAVGAPNAAGGGRAALFHGSATGIATTAARTLTASASGESFGAFIAARPRVARARTCSAR